MERTSAVSIGVAILTAGASVRMGCPKMVLPWKDSTVLGHLVSLWASLPVAQVAVVCSPENDAVRAELLRIGLPPGNHIINLNASAGMFSSVQCASLWNGWHSGTTHWAVVLGDQPQIQRDSLVKLLYQVEQAPSCIWQPSLKERPKHPVILPRHAWQRLGQSNSVHLKAFLEEWGTSRRFIELDDPGLAFDLDSPADYEQAQRVWLAH